MEISNIWLKPQEVLYPIENSSKILMEVTPKYIKGGWGKIHKEEVMEFNCKWKTHPYFRFENTSHSSKWEMATSCLKHDFLFSLWRAYSFSKDLTKESREKKKEKDKCIGNDRIHYLRPHGGDNAFPELGHGLAVK